MKGISKHSLVQPQPFLYDPSDGQTSKLLVNSATALAKSNRGAGSTCFIFHCRPQKGDMGKLLSLYLSSNLEKPEALHNTIFR